MLKALKRRVLHYLLKKTWQITFPNDIVLSEDEKKQVRSDALLLKNSILFEVVQKKITDDAMVQLYQAKTDYDLIFPQAQIHTGHLVTEILDSIIEEAKAGKKKQIRKVPKLK